MGEERIPSEATDAELGGPETSGGADPEAGVDDRSSNGHTMPSAVEKFSSARGTSPWELARLAVGGTEPDEVVPTSEGVTFFKGEVAERFHAAAGDESLLKARLARGGRRRK
jgi:hypothetical protein